MSYNVLHSPFSPMWLKDNSVSLLLHSHFFLNVYYVRVAAWCQVCRRQICKNFKQKLTALAVICPTSCCISLCRQFASSTAPFPFYYTLSSFSVFITVMSHSTFSSICLKDNSVSLLLHPQRLSLPCRCLKPGTSKTNLQKLHAEVNCIDCDMSYIVLHSTFSPIHFKGNSASLLLHSQFFLIVYRCRVAACCQVCRRQICKTSCRS